MGLKARLPKAVVALGAVSLLNDISSEMIYPLLPLFLAQLGASVAFIGLIEGIAETTASLLKLVSGWLADRFGRYRQLTAFGYGLSVLTRPLLALTTAPWQVLGLRFADRLGKGLRAAPRDALIAHATQPLHRGLAFGFHRGMDNLGAAIGPLLASGILLLAPQDYRLVFWLAVVPALVSLVALAHGLRSVSEPVPVNTAVPWRLKLPRGRFRWLLLCILIFTLGNSSDAFLLLRAEQAGVSAALVPLLWAGLNLLKSLLATPGGALSDRWGRPRVLLMGWLIYALVYAGFGFASTAWHIWALFGLYALYFALTEGTERAMVAELVPPEQRGQAFGAFHFVVGVGMLPASLLFGLVWQAFGATTAFLMGATLALLASLLLTLRRW
ncbi:MAG: MFS transporter [Fimbriimonadales bacterium]|nr:MFS transporter [Fimbriimonadales bacterium]